MKLNLEYGVLAVIPTFFFDTVNLEGCTGQILPPFLENLKDKEKESSFCF
jgi:hypothetical protein